MALDPKTLATIIKAHVKRAEEEHESWDRHRAFYRCERWGGTNPDSEELFVENGHLFGFRYDDGIGRATDPEGDGKSPQE